ncbi:hypothetical protein DSO57_1012602 [Entomophthora muscae]|uniref:Uncharacterized protein n=1 Tax=Entomophthora muscae TaxID=34485 RepID=A0ACC2UR07_9FUNG|nr:hypothetical protein DSO57_1012602 [Entomophthora muscae]
MKDSSSTKRVRFAEVDEIHEFQPVKVQNRHVQEKTKDSDSEDEDADFLEASKSRRGGVNLDGYGSDESKSDEETSISWRKKALNDDDDMFGDTAVCDTKSTKSKPKLVKISEFEGQEDPDSDLEDTKIEAFNLKDLTKEGAFDETGNFVWKAKDKNSHHDSWLTGISKEEISKAKAARDKQLERISLSEYEKNLSGVSKEKGLDLLTPDEVKLLLINLMRPHETVLASLSRLGGQTKKRVRVNKNRAKKAEQAPPETSEEMNAEVQRKKDIDRITELAAHLLDQGHLSIYQETYESLVRSARLSELIPDDWIPGTSITLPS